MEVIVSDISRDKLITKKIPSGKYIIAVSGGVDSMVLLHLLAQKPHLELVVAHFNHGIRVNSKQEEVLVAKTAKMLGLKFEAGYGHLGSGASEEKARHARYAFLDLLKKKYKAKAIITAHHQDDLIETAIINTIRGTHRKGLSSLITNKNVIRPLTKVTKKTIKRYAAAENLKWLEDESNNDSNYLRNYIRLYVSGRQKNSDRANLIKYIEKVAKLNNELDDRIATLSHKIKVDAEINRNLFALLPPSLAKELLAFWLRDLALGEFDSKAIDRLYIKLKTAPIKTKHEVDQGWWLVTDKDNAYFSNNRVGRLI